MAATLVAVSACGLIAVAGAPSAAANGRPNVLLILTDDQRAMGTMDVMPKTRQWFEDGGTRFSQFFATTPLCCPARASIFSGRYAHNHGVRDNSLETVLDQRFTIQAYLKAAGYRNGFFGKYFNGWSNLRNPPWFDDWAVFSAGYSPIAVNENGTVKTVTQYSTSYIRDNAVRFIEESENQDATPWFLELATTAPHSPSTPDTAYQSAAVPPFEPTPAHFETDKRDKPPGIQSRTVDMASVQAERANQLRTLMSVDDMVQTVFQTLEATGETSNTLAFFMSDNGFMWGEHGLRAKSDPYDPSVRLPMYMRWPGHVLPSATDSRMTANIDVAPTIYAAADGIAPPVPMDGRSLLDTMQSRTRLLTENEGWAALRTPTSHYIEYYNRAEPSRIVHREYYDLVADPFELENLLADGNAANDPPTAALSQQLAADRDCSGPACP